MPAHSHSTPARQGKPGVADILMRFLPAFTKAEAGRLCAVVRRAIWAITHCRTPALGGARYDCTHCGQRHYAYHSCNHKACPRCGRAETGRWVKRELDKRVNAPYFLVTMTVPEPVRSIFFGADAKAAYDLYFSAASRALAEKLEEAKGLRAKVSGFTAVLHTWGQRMQFHPHIHFLVPGVGINAEGKVVVLRSPKMLVHHKKLSGAFRAYFKQGLEELGWGVDPAVWRKKGWGVHIKHVGNGANAVRYLGRYVMRSVIDDRRIVECEGNEVTILWSDRAANNLIKRLTLDGEEFVRRYMRHVLPRGLRSIRHYGFCHPAAKRNRAKIQLRTGRPISVSQAPVPSPTPSGPQCPNCEKPMQLVQRFDPAHASRASRAPPRMSAKRKAA